MNILKKLRKEGRSAIVALPGLQTGSQRQPEFLSTVELEQADDHFHIFQEQLTASPNQKPQTVPCILERIHRSP